MRVLVAEDNSTSRLVLQKSLEKWGYEVITAKDGREAWDLAQAPGSPSLMILDWEMPEIDGIELCRLLREHLNDRPLYLIILTARREKEDIILGLKAGADDYVGKPFDPDELKARVQVGCRFIELLEELFKVQRALEYQARTDALTRVLNRGAILNQLESELRHTARADADFSVAILDIDHFKKVNDTFGHVAGDVVLREIAERCSRSILPEGQVGRLGGEEFLLLMPGADGARAAEILERVRDSIAGQAICYERREVVVTASLGATEVISGEEEDDILERADKALYRAKEQGRNRVVMGPAPTPGDLKVGIT